MHALGKKYKVRRRGPAGAGQGRARDSRTDRLARTRTNNQFRVVVEESHSLGVLGATGRGVSEHFGLEPRDIDILIASLSPALSSVGGICAGSHLVCDHQRLNGAGYVFSASLPPFLATAALRGLDLLRGDPGLAGRARANAAELRAALAGAPGLVPVAGAADAPVLQLRLAGADDEAAHREVAAALLEDGVLVDVPARSPLEAKGGSPWAPPPALRLFVGAAHEPADLRRAAACVRRRVAQAEGAAGRA